MALNITAEQHAVIDSYAQAGDYVGGWNYLASIGDNYADNAAAVTSGNATGVADKIFEILVKNHWDNTAGITDLGNGNIQTASGTFTRGTGETGITAETTEMVHLKEQTPAKIKHVIPESRSPPQSSLFAD